MGPPPPPRVIPRKPSKKESKGDFPACSDTVWMLRTGRVLGVGTQNAPVDSKVAATQHNATTFGAFMVTRPLWVCKTQRVPHSLS